MGDQKRPPADPPAQGQTRYWAVSEDEEVFTTERSWTAKPLSEFGKEEA